MSREEGTQVAADIIEREITAWYNAQGKEHPDHDRK